MAAEVRGGDFFHDFRAWPEKKGSRAEKRRERKKRDIPSPAKVL